MVTLPGCGVTDGLVKKLQELERTAETYQGLIEHTKKLLKATFDLSQSHKSMYTGNMVNTGITYAYEKHSGQA